jgi:hypothetical protein
MQKGKEKKNLLFNYIRIAKTLWCLYGIPNKGTNSQTRAFNIIDNTGINHFFP